MKKTSISLLLTIILIAGCTGNQTNVQSLGINSLTIGSITYNESEITIQGTDRVMTITGTIQVNGEFQDNLYLIVNNLKQNVEIKNGTISTQAILNAGTNTLQLIVETDEGVIVYQSEEWTVTAPELQQSNLVVVLSWNTDYDDVDMSIIGPNGEEAYYACKSYSCNGIGNQDLDDVNGFGPETFVLSENASSGLYQIRANYYADHGNTSSPLATIAVKHNNNVQTYTHTFESTDANQRSGPYWNPINITIN